MRSSLVLLLLSSFTVLAADVPRVLSTVEADLDGDGAPERVLLTQDAAGTVAVRVGEAVFVTRGRDAGCDDCVEFDVVDLDPTDRVKELRVRYTVMATISFDVLAFEGKRLRRIGALEATEDQADFRGHGIVVTGVWQGFWMQREKHVLQPGRKGFRAVPQELYAVNVEAKVRSPFPLLVSRSGKDVLAHVAQDTTVRVVAAGTPEKEHGLRWYLVHTSSGLMGWAREHTLKEHLALPLAG